MKSKTLSTASASQENQPCSDSAASQQLSRSDQMTLPQIAHTLSRLTPIKTPADIIGHPSPTIAQVDRTVAAGYIAAAAFKELTARYSIPVEQEHCRVWADDMIDMYPSLRLAEVRAIIRHMATIPLFNRIDVQILTQAAQSYYTYRTEQLADIREREHRNNKVNKAKDLEKIFESAPEWFQERTRELERKQASERHLSRMIHQKKEAEFKAAREALAKMMDNEVMSNDVMENADNNL